MIGVVGDAVEPAPVRALGSRGSRQPLATSDPVSPSSVLGTLPAWWAERVRRSGAPEGWRDFGRVFPASAHLIDVGAGVEVSDGIDAVTPEALGNQYVCALDPGVRAAHGRHYTPPALARRLWAECGRYLEHRQIAGRVVDPACGAGALLLPIVRKRVEAALKSGEPYGSVADSLMGWDLDEQAVMLANVVIQAELLPLAARDGVETDHSRLPCRVRDGLAVDETRFAAVVMNPPYGRVRLRPDERNRFAHAVYGHANLYGLFMAAAVDLLDDDGVLTALVPTSFLGGAYFQRLRETLATAAPVTAVQFVVERSGVFANGVLQETCVATFQRGKTSGRVRVGQMVGPGADHASIGTTAAHDSPGPWLLPRRKTDAKLANGARRLPARLANFGWRVSTGPLVWNRHKSQFRSRPTRRSVPVIWAADLRDGGIDLSASRADLRWLEPTPFQEHLVLDQPAVLLQRTTAPEQSRRLVASALTEATLDNLGGRVIVENHVNVLTQPDVLPGLSILDAPLLTRLLRTETLDRLFRCITGSVAVSAYELGDLALPNDKDLLALTKMTDADLDQSLAVLYETGKIQPLR